LQRLHALAQDDRQHDAEREDADAGKRLFSLAVQALEGFVRKQPAAGFDGLLFLSMDGSKLDMDLFYFKEFT
jgi:hypothetical protein